MVVVYSILSAHVSVTCGTHAQRILTGRIRKLGQTSLLCETEPFEIEQ